MRSLTPVSRSLVLPVLRFDAQSSHLSAKSTQLYRLVEQHYPAFVTYLAEQGKSLPALLRRYDAQGCTSVAGGRMPGATIARPALAEKRLTVNAQGKVVYLPKTPYRDATTHVVFESLDFIVRLAALNMLTRTSAQEYVRDGIHMNSVHTGWITDEDPAHLAQHRIDMHLFAPPLDVVDGAARIVDPIFAGLATGRHAWGQFFKDYKPTCW